MLDLFKIGKLLYSNTPLIGYRQHDQSMTKTQEKIIHSSENELIEIHRKEINSLEINSELKIELLNLLGKTLKNNY